MGIVMRNTRTIINRAIKKRKVSYNVHPFVDYSIPQSPVRDVSIRLESLSKILNAEVDSNYLSVARDLFSLSFYLGGINMTDLMDMDFEALGIYNTPVRRLWGGLPMQMSLYCLFTRKQPVL